MNRRKSEDSLSKARQNLVLEKFSFFRRRFSWALYNFPTSLVMNEIWNDFGDRSGQWLVRDVWTSHSWNLQRRSVMTKMRNQFWGLRRGENFNGRRKWERNRGWQQLDVRDAICSWIERFCCCFFFRFRTIYSYFFSGNFRFCDFIQVWSAFPDIFTNFLRFLRNLIKISCVVHNPLKSNIYVLL